MGPTKGSGGLLSFQPHLFTRASATSAGHRVGGGSCGVAGSQAAGFYPRLSSYEQCDLGQVSLKTSLSLSFLICNTRVCIKREGLFQLSGFCLKSFNISTVDIE